MSRAGLLLAASVALAPLVLGGCVAAAVPVVAGSLLAKKQIFGKNDDDKDGAKSERARTGAGTTEYTRQERTIAPAAAPAAPASAEPPTAQALDPREQRRADKRARKQAKREAKDARRAVKAAARAAKAEAEAAAPKPPTARQKQTAARQARREEKRKAKQARQAAEAPAQPETPPVVRLRPIAKNEIPLPAATAGAPIALTGLTALPAPGSASDVVGAPFPAFVRYALTAARPQPGQPFRSALIDPATLTTAPTRSTCDKQPPAVLVDLDPDKGPFDLNDPPAAEPGLAEDLARLRAAGLVVLWQASLPAMQSERLYAILAATGLDPDRTDRLLLLRKDGERKQTRRNEAARDWCILAIAGNNKGDFEEAFDYLRDPKGPIAQALAPNLGDGWFLTPPPIH